MFMLMNKKIRKGGREGSFYNVFFVSFSYSLSFGFCVLTLSCLDIILPTAHHVAFDSKMPLCTKKGD